jgi:membrane-bound inhibitor of C-type lysozyme
MAAPHALHASLLGVPLVVVVPAARAAEPVCAEAKALSTVAETRCLIAALEELDGKLETALAAVAREAAAEPGERFLPLWRENLTSFYRTSADPGRQAEDFRRQRRAACAYAKSVGFQGTGYGIHTSRCELALTRTLLDQLQPETERAPAVEMRKPVSYRCDGGGRLEVRYGRLGDGSLSFARLQPPGDSPLTLPQLVSGSGTRYSDEQRWQWWSKGEEGFLQRRDNDGQWRTVLQGCRSMKP